MYHIRIPQKNIIHISMAQSQRLNFEHVAYICTTKWVAEFALSSNEIIMCKQ